MGVHHAWGRSYKDLYNRFWTMRGRKLRYQNGFDCQGLWIEVEVEKELGFKSKHDIETFGVAAARLLARDGPGDRAAAEHLRRRLVAERVASVASPASVTRRPRPCRR